MKDLGIKSIKIVNKVQLCEDQSRCSKITEYNPKQTPLDVVSFFVPATEDIIGKVHL